MEMSVMKSFIDMTFKRVGADRGIDINATNIINWREQGLIKESEYRELRHYNRLVYSKLPLDA